jgi:RNA polymerase sigma-70 factor (ECF subfamily)
MAASRADPLPAEAPFCRLDWSTVSRVVGGVVALFTESSEAQRVRALHDEYARNLWAYALRFTGGDHGRAQDAVQETLLRAWRHSDALDPARGASRAWLFTTMRHVLIDEWRSSKARPQVVTDEIPELPRVDHADRAVQSWLLGDALGQLSPAHRDVIVECFYHDRTVRAAAERLGVPVGTVKSRVYYALRALKLALEQRGVTA